MCADVLLLQFVVHFLASFHDICVVTAMLPLFTLLCCFVSAYVFQADEVHETHCRVSILISMCAVNVRTHTRVCTSSGGGCLLSVIVSGGLFGSDVTALSNTEMQWSASYD